ncbi:hypothetical protein [Blastopirellula marina]|uniref:Uncharacterized protein n=1 Tax=Blastopirellula marina DSM 3645 TaxID=314230 RepID=A3ZYR1_9BACT|nr:hypothetical protein [Blastopirellula marina]EAQ78272.1 hypothetical protein DSM3645_18086 [Blastopirellula marina DSM 3645]
MKTASLSLLLAALLTSSAAAQNQFMNQHRITPDATKLEHAAARLGAQLTSANQAQLASAANTLKALCERYRQNAARQANYYYLQREFRSVSVAYKELERFLDSTLPEPRPYGIRTAWHDLQKSYDQLYFDLFGYDAIDPYFGQHADFAATPPMTYYQPSLRRRSYYYSAPLIYDYEERETTRITPAIIPYRSVPLNPTPPQAPTVRPRPRQEAFDLDPSTSALDL